jgi:hypothetical protein
MAAMAGRIDRREKKPLKARDSNVLGLPTGERFQRTKGRDVSDVLGGASEFFRRVVGIGLEIVRRDRADGVCRGKKCTGISRPDKFLRCGGCNA